MSKLVSQKRFAKGINAAPGVLSQQPGSIVRGSNVLLTQRGSLQVCDGSASIGQLPSPFIKAIYIDLFTKYASGQYPTYVVLANPVQAILANVTNFALSTSGGTGTSILGKFTIIARGSYSGTPIVSGPTVILGSWQHNAGITLNFSWTAVAAATGYDIYWSTPQSATIGNKFASNIPGTLVGGLLTYSYSGFPAGGTTAIPQLTVGTIQLLIGSVTPPSTVVVFSPVVSSPISASVPQPAQLAPGDPDFSFDTINTTQSTVYPVAPGGLVTATANYATPSDTETTSVGSGWATNPVVTSETITLYVPTSGSISISGPGSGYGTVNYQYSTDSGSTWNTFSSYSGNDAQPALWNETLSVAIPATLLTDISHLQVQVVASASYDASNSGVMTSTASVTSGVYAVTTVSTSFSPYGGISGLACVVPELLQFAGLEIVVLGNGYAPQYCDPSSLAGTGLNPLTNSFQSAYPTWQSGVDWISGAQLAALDGAVNYLFTATQGGVSGSTAPTWAFTQGAQTADGSVIWTCNGPIAVSVAPRGAAHAVAYAGSLWLANTAPSTTSDQLDGPTVLKMSDSNNPNSWNPVNVAFIGRDDGSQITGIQPFTIAALGISPTGSMAVFKEFQTYQIIGVFGSNNFEIQEAQTDMGCLACRSIQFIPGFGVVRWTHLGFAVYDGVNDRLISEEIRPYLFGGVGTDADLVPVDPTFAYLSKSAQSAKPPMYMCAMPLMEQVGALTRVFCYDLIMKSWVIIDLPWVVSSLNRVKAGEGNPLVVAGKLDGTVQRLQSGETAWDATNTATATQWGFRTPDVFGEGSSQRIFYREMVLRGYATVGQTATITITPTLDGAVQPSMALDIIPQAAASGQFEIRANLWLNGQICHLDIAGQGQIVIDSIDWDIMPKSASARRVIG